MAWPRSSPSLDYLVGTRFHSVIFALAARVPCIAIGYEHKTRGIMRDLSLDGWVLPARGAICCWSLWPVRQAGEAPVGLPRTSRSRHPALCGTWARNNGRAGSRLQWTSGAGGKGEFREREPDRIRTGLSHLPRVHCRLILNATSDHKSPDQLMRPWVLANVTGHDRTVCPQRLVDVVRSPAARARHRNAPTGPPSRLPPGPSPCTTLAPGRLSWPPGRLRYSGRRPGAIYCRGGASLPGEWSGTYLLPVAADRPHRRSAGECRSDRSCNRPRRPISARSA